MRGFVLLAVLIGTRPEAIKLRSIVHELNKRNADFRVIYTGQQMQLEKEFFLNLNIPILITLSAREHFDSIPEELSRLLTELNAVLMNLDFHGVIVQGDTTTALAGALTAAMLKIPVHHVEAGLRTHNRLAPFPEELNRKVISVLANDNFAPTVLSENNLLKEGVDPSTIHVVGNTVVDSLKISLPIIQSSNFEMTRSISKERIFVSCHRRELSESQRNALARTILRLSLLENKFQIDFTLHSNPLFSNLFRQQLENRKNITLHEGLSYLETLRLISSAKLVITDSGGLQEECVTLGVPLLIYRTITERPECLSPNNTGLLAPRDEEFSSEILAFLRENVVESNYPLFRNIVGDGNSASRIVDIIIGSRS